MTGIERFRQIVSAWTARLRSLIASPEVANLSRNLPSTIRSRLPAVVGVAPTGRTGEPAVPSMGIGAKTFLCLVLLPTFVMWAYALLWETRGYSVELRLTVRAAPEQKGSAIGGSDSSSSMTSLISKFTGGSKSTSQDTYIVLNYLKSRALIADIGGRAYFESIFSGDDIDYFSRLGRGADMEDLLKYWNKHISASVESMSSILTIQVDAYSPEAALRLSQDVVRLSEGLVNQITLRGRKDALKRADQEVSVSSERLAEVREKLLQFRNANLLIDPASKVASISEMISKLTMEKIDIEASLSALTGSLSADSPSERISRAKLAVLNKQIAEAKAKLTGEKVGDTLSSQIAGYERLKLEEQFAKTLYEVAQTSYQKARQELEKQVLYLVVVVAPTLPEAPATPKVFASTVLLFCELGVVWAIFMLIGAAFSDQMI
jgi:capsular polysaccharide transport system permease protein